ncbi:hypothetical protein [Humisphaera borealis]|uniref:Uncharacterized protein n=1 Tax=Humisphaera borealis TaxID=2807512 RepID=A0A7M2X001_9BACT|nr:hypothetical protein [Humisphaera borealis]QOV90964.1 hypothetical protein IPV69_06275 [Humisphaera borealis]
MQEVKPVAESGRELRTHVQYGSAANTEFPPPLPPDMIDLPPDVRVSPAAETFVAQPVDRKRKGWSLSVPTIADLSDRARLGQVVLGFSCFFVYAAAALGVGRDTATALFATPILPIVLVPLLVVGFVLLFRAQAFGRGFVLGIVVCILGWLVAGMFRALAAGT